MSNVWTGSITLPTGTQIRDVIISSNTTPSLPSNATLRLLSLIDTAHVPLQIIAGPPLAVSTTCLETESWFSSVLLGPIKAHEEATQPWWHSASQSPLGLLVQVQNSDSVKDRITEILFYCDTAHVDPHALPSPPSSSPNDPGTDATHDQPNLYVKALPLRSDLWGIPDADAAQDPQHVDARSPELDSIAREAAELTKRKSMDSVFDRATEQRRKAKRKGGESTAAKSSKHDMLLGLSHLRKPSIDTKPVVSSPLTDVFRTRSPSTTSDSRPASRRGTIDPQQKSSTLSKVSTAASALEERNRDSISRVVMAGMRLHGLQQRKKSKKTTDITPVNAEQEVEAAAKDEEFKLIYHQVFKGTVFAFRHTITTTSIAPHIDKVNDIVDRLLSIFCTDPTLPTIIEPPSSIDRTPASRHQPMATPSREALDPFAFPGGSQVSEKGVVNTPSIKRVVREAR